MKFYENNIELSDKHVLWQLHNDNLSAIESEYLWNDLIMESYHNFKRIYGVDFEMLGRSGRHICVEDTPKNRMNYCRMVKTIDKMQKYMVETFNSARA